MTDPLPAILDELRAIRRLLEADRSDRDGRCPECDQVVRGYDPPFGTFAPEMWATLRERGINPATGHRKGCSRG